MLLAAILAAATFVESDKGRDYARWYFYTQTWFVALLGMLGVNILAATLIRFPWKLRQFGFVVTHAGLLVLLAGSIVTFNYGIDATISLEEGETGDHVTVRDLNRFSVQWRPTAGQPDRPVSQFIFTPGPVDWPEGKSLLLGEINGVKLRVTRYLAHARPAEEWMADPDGNGIAAMKFSLVGPDNTENAEQWLTATRFGGSTAVGSAKVEFQQAEADTMVDDFLNPPAKEDLDPQGLLTIHYEGRVTRLPVSKNVGKKVPLDGGDASVEIAQYLPNARLQADGRFVNVGDKPRNPVVELRVYLPGGKEPVRQVAKAVVRQPRRHAHRQVPGEVLVSPPGRRRRTGRGVPGHLRRQALLPRGQREVRVAGRGPCGRHAGRLDRHRRSRSSTSCPMPAASWSLRP